jgi:heme O synthase-like polyprenyltransferase
MTSHIKTSKANQDFLPVSQVKLFSFTIQLQTLTQQSRIIVAQRYSYCCIFTNLYRRHSLYNKVIGAIRIESKF